MRRLVRRHPWVMFPAGLVLTVPAGYAFLFLIWIWALVLPAVIILLLIFGPPAYGAVQGWRGRSYPAVWFGAGYTVGVVLIAVWLACR